MQIVETRIFLRGTVMKASSHEKHSKQQWKKQKKQKVQTHGQGLGRGLAGDMGLNFLFVCFLFFHGFLQFGQNLENTKKNKKQKQKVQTHGQGLGYPHTNQKNKKTKNTNTKKKTTKKNKIAHPKGRGSDAECWVLSFFLCVFLVFCFFLFFLVLWFVCG